MLFNMVTRACNASWSVFGVLIAFMFKCCLNTCSLAMVVVEKHGLLTNICCNTMDLLFINGFGLVNVKLL